MALNIGDNFSYLGAKPLDARRVFASKAALDAVSLSTVYEGMVAYTQLEDKYYRLKSGVWVEFQSGSGITDWVASTSYSVGQYVNYSGSLYKCTTANNDSTFTASHWQQISGGAGIANWASSTSYAVGALVIYSDKIYECTTAHTSSTTFDANKWKEISASAGGIANWTTNKSYSVGDLVINSNKIYQCNTAHTSGSTFSTDASKWTEISASTGGIDNWATAKSYVVGDVVYHNESIFVCNTAHTSSTFSTEASNWTLMYADIKQWKQNTYYVVDTVLIYDGELYKCKTAHDSGSAFTSANFDKIFSDPKEMTNAEVAAMIANFNPSGDGLMLMPNWEANHGYVVMQCVYYSGDMYRCKTAHTSGSTFNSTEEAYWDKIVGGGGTSISSWTTGTNYAVGDFVIYSNKIYKCITANADASFTPTKWQGISVETELSAWATSTSYKVGDYVLYQNNLYRCNTAHTSSTFSSDIAKWNLVGGIKDWQASTDYFVGDFIYYSNNIYRVKTDFTSTSTFSDTNLDMIGGTPLTSTEVTNLINDFTPSGAIYGSMKDMYSTNERAIGIWIDGKTLYQKTIVTTTPTTTGGTGISVDIGATIDIGFIDSGFIQKSDGGCEALNVYGDSTFSARTWILTDNVSVTGSKNKLRMSVTASALTNCPCYITIKYTKV